MLLMNYRFNPELCCSKQRLLFPEPELLLGQIHSTERGTVPGLENGSGSLKSFRMLTLKNQFTKNVPKSI